MPSPRELVADVLELARPPSTGARADRRLGLRAHLASRLDFSRRYGRRVESSLARAVLVDAWLPRRRSRAARPRGGRADLRRAARAPRARGAASSRRAACGRATASPSASPPGAGVRASRCTPACCSARSRCPSTRGSGPRRRRASPAARASWSSERARGAWIAAAATRRRRRAGGETHDLDATAIVVHTSGTSAEPKRVALTYGNWLWSALGSAAALGVDPRERWLCCLPLSHVGGLSILVRWAIYATTAVVHERFETERVLAALRDPDGPTLVSLVPTTLARLLDAGPARPAGAALGAARRRRDPRALLERAARRRRAGRADLRHDRGLLAGRDVRAAAVLHARAHAPDGEMLVSGPTVAPAARAVARDRRHRRDRRERRRSWSPAARRTRSSPAARTSRRRRSRRCSAAHRAVAEAAVHGRADARVGRGDRRARRAARGRAGDERGAARLLRRAARGVQGPEGDRVRRQPAAHGVGQARAQPLPMDDITRVALGGRGDKFAA